MDIKKYFFGDQLQKEKNLTKTQILKKERILLPNLKKNQSQKRQELLFQKKQFRTHTLMWAALN